MKKKKSFPRVFVRNLVLKFFEKAQQPPYKKHMSKTNHQQKNKYSQRKSLVERESWQKHELSQEAEASFTTLSPKEKEFTYDKYCVMPPFAQFQGTLKKQTAKHSPTKSIYCHLLCSDIQWELHCSLTKHLQQISK